MENEQADKRTGRSYRVTSAGLFLYSSLIGFVLGGCITREEKRALEESVPRQELERALAERDEAIFSLSKAVNKILSEKQTKEAKHE